VREADWETMATVGRIARTHGNRGQVIVNPETDFAGERFRVGRVLHLRRGAAVATLTVDAVRFHQGRPILGFREVATMTEAAALAGAELRIPPGDLVRLPEGRYYRHDLVGCTVTTVSGGVVGTVARVEGGWHGSHLVVEAGGGEVLVPLADAICVRVDTAAREIVIDPPAGLLDLNG